MDKKDRGMLPYTSVRIGGRHLISNHAGSWCFLDDGELRQLNAMRVGENGNLLSKLEDAGIMISMGNAGRLVNEYRSLNRFLFQGPSLHIVVPTLRCNHACVYCHAKPPKSEGLDMSMKTAAKVLDFIFKTESKAVTIEFQGGEPLLNFGIVKYVTEEARRLNESFEKKDLRITVVSNLTLMDDEKLAFFRDNGVTLCTSLDGPGGVHDMNRKYLGGTGTHADVVRWITKIKKDYPDLRLNALPTITRHSLPRWKEIIDEYVRLGFETIHMRFLNRLGAAAGNWKEIGYSAEEFIGFWKQSMDYIIGLNEKGAGIKERLATVMLTKILRKEDPGFTELMSPCGAGRTQLLYDHDGSIFTCDEGRMLGSEMFRLGSVNEDKYGDVIKSDGFISVCHASVLDNYCRACAFRPFCGTCPVMNFAEQGNVIPRITETMRCKIYKSQFTYLFNRISEDQEALKIFERWTRAGKDKEEATGNKKGH
jgi:uncharacterized protein